MLLQHERDGTAQACHARIARRPDSRRLPDQHRGGNLGFNDRTEPWPLPRELPDNDNFLRCQAGNHHAHSPANGVSHSVQCANRQGITGFEQTHKILKGESVGGLA